ncbi:MAG: hypothetical protein IME94_10705 [Proteobacteria bacterium]|nr:hypothetical protein [Pseudomonadota bacterium]
MADKLATELSKEDNIRLWAKPKTGITVFRPLTCSTKDFYQRLPEGMLSTCILQNKTWLRSVSANPLADIEKIISNIQKSCQLNI